MNEIDFSYIQRHAPYSVWKEDNVYLFRTENDILYSVEFEQDAFGSVPAYWFNLTNRSSKKSPRNRNIQATVICLIEAFFHTNADVLLYMCDTADNQQAMRSRLFMYWFNSYEAKEHFIVKSARIVNGQQPDYIAMIVSRNHPYAEQIAELFEAEVALFKNNKP